MQHNEVCMSDRQGLYFNFAECIARTFIWWLMTKLYKIEPRFLTCRDMCLGPFEKESGTCRGYTLSPASLPFEDKRSVLFSTCVQLMQHQGVMCVVLSLLFLSPLLHISPALLPFPPPPSPFFFLFFSSSWKSEVRNSTEHSASE